MDFFKAHKFRPSKEDIWRQIAAEIGGEFIPGKGWWASSIKDKLEFRHGNWTIVLDYFSTGEGKNRKLYTRMRAPFINKDGFYFNLYRETIFSGIGRALGMQDIEIGDPAFDKEFVIKSNSEEKIRTLLNSKALKELMHDMYRIQLEIKDSERKFFFKTFPEGVDMLYFQCRYPIQDPEVLKKLFLIFAGVLERLVQMDSAYEDDPLIDLK